MRLSITKIDPLDDGTKVVTYMFDRIRDIDNAEVHCVGWGNKTVAIPGPYLHLGFGKRRAPSFGLRRAFWDMCYGYVSGFRKRDILYYILTRSLSRRIQDHFVKQKHQMLYGDLAR